MTKGILIVLLSFACLFSNGQGKNSIWCFGDSAGIDFRNTLSPIPFTSGMNSKGTCASISDSVGSLLFYCSTPDIVGFWNGVYPLGIVYNNNHQMMANGDSLNCIAWYHEMVIVPDPANSQLYYIFHIGVTGQYGLYYSVVDMTLDSGRGAVISKNNQVRNEVAVDCIQAVRNGNGKDWWVIYKKAQPANNYFYVYSINSGGVQLDHIDSIGFQGSSNGGDLRFNSDGSKFALCNWKVC